MAIFGKAAVLFSSVLILYFKKSHQNLEFYPYGNGTTDQVVPSNDDDSSGQVSLSIPIKFFDDIFNTVFVNTNGAISFTVEVSQYTPDAFPLADGRQLIAPFWADVDTRKGGTVFYRETTDVNILNLVNSDIRQAFIKFQSYKAIWAFVATWHKVAYFGRALEKSHIHNTFQAVLTTDGHRSFTIFNYGNISWTTGTSSDGDKNGLGGTQAQAGFNAGDGRRYFNLPHSRTHNIIDVESTSNVGIPGKWIFRIDLSSIQAGGCNEAGQLTLSPFFGHPLGGTLVTLSGPCFNSSSQIVCRFGGHKVNGTAVDNVRATCITPWQLAYSGQSRILAEVSSDGGITYTHKTFFTLIQLSSDTVERIRADEWSKLNSPMILRWDANKLNSSFIHVECVLGLEPKIDSSQDPQVVFLQIMQNITNTGEVWLPNALHITTWLEAGAIRLRPSESSVSNPVSLWSDIHTPDWLLKAMFKNLLAKPQSHIQRREVGDSGLLKSFVRGALTAIESINAGIKSAINAYNELKASRDSARCRQWYEKNSPPPATLQELISCPCTFDYNIEFENDRRFNDDLACNRGSGCRYHVGAHHCIRSISPSQSGHRQQCCYDQAGNILPFENGGGTVDLGSNLLSHYFKDVRPYNFCCKSGNKDLCSLYSELRPTDDCSGYQPERPTNTFGDPHFITIDGFKYTFNGLGEFYLITYEESNNLLMVQGRTKVFNSPNNITLTATSWEAFVTAVDVSDTVEVSISPVRGMVLVIHGEDVTETFQDLSYQEYNGVTIEANFSIPQIKVKYPGGPSFKYEAVGNNLMVSIQMPKLYQGKLKGLLGNFNGNKSDDLISSLGDHVAPDSDLKTIHNSFGLSWMVPEGKSLFLRENNSMPANNANFVPSFDIAHDSVNSSISETLCNGDSACIFDYIVTGNEDLAKSSAKASLIYKKLASLEENPIRTCGFLKTPANGSLTLTNGYRVGSTVTFTCQPGFELTGSTSLKCQASSLKWNGVEPECTVVNKPSRADHPSLALHMALLVILIASSLFLCS
ncbi:unnamed protein product [Dimorphilus gyrociliatus]|uniref:Uncharacterized protein n=1 Tax=Dimorphilus gyrociliatus TaxID=2664684 RepID=A0A7I8WEI7_9ANNE|nr:unnamed protein product [Dimorphilus gyrociliatus]